MSLAEAITDLPRLRSGLSKEPDSSARWADAVRSIQSASWVQSSQVDDAVRSEIRGQIEALENGLERGSKWMRPSRRSIRLHPEWFQDDRLTGVCNHVTRGHIRADLHRYFFASAFTRVHGRSPLLEDLPRACHAL